MTNQYEMGDRLLVYFDEDETYISTVIDASKKNILVRYDNGDEDKLAQSDDNIWGISTDRRKYLNPFSDEKVQTLLNGYSHDVSSPTSSGEFIKGAYIVMLQLKQRRRYRFDIDDEERFCAFWCEQAQYDYMTGFTTRNTWILQVKNPRWKNKFQQLTTQRSIRMHIVDEKMRKQLAKDTLSYQQGKHPNANMWFSPERVRLDWGL